MRILQLGPYPPPHGGVQTNLVAIREFLRQRGLSCEVINITRSRHPDAEGVYYPRSAVEVLKLLLQLRYDIVHLHLGGSVSPRLLGLSLVCCSMPRAKAVLTLHSGGYPSSSHGKRARAGTVRGFVFRRFDAVIAVNPELAALFRKYGLPEAKIRLIHPHRTPVVPSGVVLPDRLRDFFAAHRPLLLSVGLLEREYDLPLPIDVLGPVRQRFPNAGLLILGAGRLERMLEDYIRAKPYREHVLLYGDAPHSVTLRAIADCDVFLRTTLYDGDAISVREALSLGSPVIATDNGMRPQGVELIPAGNPEALCAAIERCLLNPRPRVPTGTGGEGNIEAVYRLYQELLG